MREFLYRFYVKHYLTEGKFNGIIPSKLILGAIFFAVVLTLLGDHNSKNILGAIAGSYVLVLLTLVSFNYFVPNFFKKSFIEMVSATALPLGLIGFLINKNPADEKVS